MGDDVASCGGGRHGENDGAISEGARGGDGGNGRDGGPGAAGAGGFACSAYRGGAAELKIEPDTLLELGQPGVSSTGASGQAGPLGP